MVFAPAPVLTVTIEQPADRPELHLHPGGQGIWQARMISSLGGRVTLCSCIGGETGRALEPLITSEGIALRSVPWAAGNGWYVHDRRDGDRKQIAASAGQPLGRHELDDLYGLTLAEGVRSAVSVLSGPADSRIVPAEVYRRLASDLRRNGVRVVADLSGRPLDEVLAGGVDVLKVSDDELVDAGLIRDTTEDELVRAIEKLRAGGADAVVVTRAESASLAHLDGALVRVIPPPLEAAEPKGAGDSMTAAIATVLAQGGDLREAVRSGAAAGAVNVTRRGLGSGSPATVAEMAHRVRIEPLEAG